MRGFEIELKQGKDLSIATLFGGIRLDDVFCHVLDCEIIRNNQPINNEREVIESALIKHNEFPNTWIHKLVLHIYPNGAEPRSLLTYEDYFDSPCELILLVYDVVYAEVYVKRIDWFTRLLKNTEQLPLIHLALKTNQTDMRSVLLV